MKSILKLAFAVGLSVAAGSAPAPAQTVVLDGLGSSAFFLEAGLAANYSGGAINAPCVWSENTNAVVATDSSTGSSLTDKGSAWVAWTKGSDGTCATAGNIYAYLQTDSVVGNRCLFNSNLSAGRECYITYPTTPASPAGLILSGGTANCGTTGECALPSTVVTALNSSTQLVNFAGTDIRPEDAEFAIARATTACNTPVATGSQYLGLGYANGGAIDSYTNTGSFFNVINFTLPTTVPHVTLVGATPIIVTVNGTSAGFGGYSNISSQTLAYFLDGTYSYTGQVATPTATDLPAWVYLREPLSGTYNTLEYNVPNRLGTIGGSSPTFATSQDVGANQITSGQKNCNSTFTAPLSNPMNIATASSGARQRAIGTGQELAAVKANANGNSLGYGFWSAANFAGFAGVTTAKYYTVDSIDPLGAGGTIPTTSTQLANVNLSSTANGTYPIWSLLRMVNVDTSLNTTVADLATAAGDFVTASHPDFVTPANMNVVRSHFLPPAGSGLPTTLSDGSKQLHSGSAVACSSTETGGDVGGVVIGLTSSSYTQSPLTLSDEYYCTHTSTTGQTGHRR